MQHYGNNEQCRYQRVKMVGMVSAKGEDIVPVFLKRNRALFYLATVLLLGMVLSLTAVAEVPYDSYTYWRSDDGSRKLVSNRPMYEPLLAIDASAFGEEDFDNLSDVAVDADGTVYLLDAGKGVLYLLDSQYQPIGTIAQAVIDGGAADFSGAKGVFAVDKDHIYIADTDNGRVLLMDQQGTVSRVLTLPDSELILDDFAFRPSKVTADANGYTYVLSDGSYYGALIYDPDGSFDGFYGANKVYGPTIGFLDRLYDRLFSNNEKRSGQMLKLPYQFTDLAVDKEGYIYTITGRTSSTIQYGQIKRLNAAGTDILVNSGINFADEELLTLLNEPQAQDLLSLAVDDNGFIYALDSVFGRVFVYDVESNLLTAFGGGLSEGEQLGTFKQAVAVAATRRDVLVVDSAKKNLTVFRANAYGQAVKDCQLLTLGGHYEEAEPGWQAILQQDRANQLAYQALAQAAILKGDYDTAMDYARIAENRELYSQAYQYVRNTVIRKNFVWIFPALIMVVLLVAAWLIYTTRRKLVLIRNATLRELVSTSIHPFQIFGNMKEKRRSGSPLVCAVLIVLFYITSILGDTASGFLFSNYDAATFNSFFVLLRTFGLILLWGIANWLIASLFEGKGTLADVMTVTCYSLLPLILTQLIALPLSHVLLLEEGTFLHLLQTLGVLYTLMLIVIGTMVIHDFSLMKFIGTALLTLFGMAVVVFVIFMIVILLQQGYGFVVTVFSEMMYR